MAMLMHYCVCELKEQHERDTATTFCEPVDRLALQPMNKHVTANKRDNTVKWFSNCNRTGEAENRDSSIQIIDCKMDSVQLMDQGFNRTETHSVESQFNENTRSLYPVATTFKEPVDRVAAVKTRSRASRDLTNGEDVTDEQVHIHNQQRQQENGPSNDTILPWSLDGLRAEQRKDPDIGFFIELLENHREKPEWNDVSLKSNDVKTLWNLWPRMSMRDGLLKRRYEDSDGKSERWQTVMPKTLRADFLAIAHSGMTGGHMGKSRTAAAIQSRAYWPTWSSDLDLFMKQCEPCAKYHRGTLRRTGELQTSLVGEPWERISIDITGPHPRSSRGNKFILTVLDHFSKWAEAIPLSNHTAPAVAKALLVHVFSRYGVPMQLLSDRGPEFESELFNQLMSWLEIDKLRTTAYKPSTNGTVERFHRTLNSMLGKVVSDNQRDWDDRLPFVMAAYRASPHSSTRFSPNRLFLGRENRMPLDLLMGLPLNESEETQTLNEFVIHVQQQAQQAYALAREKLRVAAERRKAYYDIKVRMIYTSATGFGIIIVVDTKEDRLNGSDALQDHI